MVRLAVFGSVSLCFWGFVSADGIIKQEGTTYSDHAHAVVLTGGLPVVAGWTRGDFPGMTNLNSDTDDGVIVKYNLDGTRNTLARIGTTSEDRISASAVDASNDILVVGRTDGNLSGTNAGSGDIFLAKFDANLNQRWLVQDGSASYDMPYAVAFDSSGRVIVGGYTGGAWNGQSSAGGATDALLLRFSSGGTFEWAFQCGSSGSDYVYGITIDMVDSADNIYATGSTTGSFEGNTHNGSTDIFLIKVSTARRDLSNPMFYVWEMFVRKQFEQKMFSTLNESEVSGTPSEIWSVQVGTSSDDRGMALVIDSMQNVYVSGYTNGQLGATQFGNYDGFLMKYDTDGVQQWVIQFGTTSGDYADGLCIDTNDKLYAVIRTWGSMAGTALGAEDIAVIQVDSTGSVLWTDQFGTGGNEYISDIGGNPITVDSAGDLFIAGSTASAFTGYYNQGSHDWFLYKMEAKTTTTTFSTTWTSMTSSSATSSSTTFSTTSTTGSMTSTSTSSRSLVAVVAG